MLLPNKFINLKYSLLGTGAIITNRLDAFQTINGLWFRIQDDDIIFHRFILSLDFLFTIRVIGLKNDMLISHVVSNKPNKMNNIKKSSKNIQILKEENRADEDLLFLCKRDQFNDLKKDVLIRLYNEIGMTFKSATLCKIEEVCEFHDKIATNRTLFLADKIKCINRRIEQRNKEIDILSYK